MAIEGAFTVNSQLGHLSIAPAARTERSRVITFWLTEEDCMTAACADMYPSRWTCVSHSSMSFLSVIVIGVVRFNATRSTAESESPLLSAVGLHDLKTWNKNIMNFKRELFLWNASCSRTYCTRAERRHLHFLLFASIPYIILTCATCVLAGLACKFYRYCCRFNPVVTHFYFSFCYKQFVIFSFILTHSEAFIQMGLAQEFCTHQISQRSKLEFWNLVFICLF